MKTRKTKNPLEKTAKSLCKQIVPMLIDAFFDAKYEIRIVSDGKEVNVFTNFGDETPEGINKRRAEHLKEILKSCDWNVSKTARKLRIRRTRLVDLIWLFKICRFEQSEIQTALDKTKGNIEEAGKILGVSGLDLHCQMLRYGM